MEKQGTPEKIKPAAVLHQPRGWNAKKIEAWKQTCGSLNFGGMFDDEESCKMARYGE